MDKKLYLTLILVRTLYTGRKILVKVALNAGMSTFVLTFYDQATATVFLALVAIISKRQRASPLSFNLLFKTFLLALCGGTLTLELYNIALGYTSASLAAAVGNTVPAITFLLAVILRKEAVKIKSLVGAAKILGVALSLAGVMAIAFYQGPPLKSLNHHPLLLGHGTSATGNSGSSSSKTWIKGCFLMLLAATTASLWLVLQVGVLKQYSSKLLYTTLVCFFSTIQSFFAALIFERDFTRWKLGLDIRLLSVAYCVITFNPIYKYLHCSSTCINYILPVGRPAGRLVMGILIRMPHRTCSHDGDQRMHTAQGIIVTGVALYLQSWCIARAGPVVLASSTPLSFVITITCLSFIFGETISSGSIVGGVLMVGGLYSVLWGKHREQAYGSRLPVVSMEDGKDKLQTKQMSSPLGGAAKESNLDSSDSKCRIDQKS